jgi:hypothetical protein
MCLSVHVVRSVFSGAERARIPEKRGVVCDPLDRSPYLAVTIREAQIAWAISWCRVWIIPPSARAIRAAFRQAM